MLDIEMETEEEYDEYKEHGNPLQHIEVVIQLDQCICGYNNRCQSTSRLGDETIASQIRL